jgi:hypothetical protein
MIPSTVLGKNENEAASCYRVIAPAYAGTPLSGKGAARRGGRFNRPGQEALYLSLHKVTALAEYKQDNPWLPPGMILETAVGRARAGCHRVGWQGARTPLQLMPARTSNAASAPEAPSFGGLIIGCVARSPKR